MKTKNITGIVAFVMLCLFTLPVAAQDAKTQLLWVHEDYVKPYMAEKYEVALKDLKDALTKHKIQAVDYVTLMQDDYTYLAVSELENMAELDKSPMDALKGKLSEAEWKSLWQNFDDCYDEHRTLIASYHEDLSYKPGNMMEEGLNYRRWTFYSVMPGKEKEADDIAKEWTALHKKKNAPHGYRIYKDVLGIEGPMIVVVAWAKGPVEMQSQEQKNLGALGEDEFKRMMKKTMAVTRAIEVKDGWMLPQYSYMPAPPATATK